MLRSGGFSDRAEIRAAAGSDRDPPRRMIWRVRPRPDAHPYGIMRRVSPTLVTPRDFDLSPYFEIIKFNVIENLRFDYRKILWAEDEQVIPEKKPA